ncbi:MAG: hypothetical protein QHJ82_03370 [Verrucomicrobiota bacterium]|nr:hypothetical protein [Verrucomicrobiota bacterium]
MRAKSQVLKRALAAATQTEQPIHPHLWERIGQGRKPVQFHEQDLVVEAGIVTVANEERR